MLTNIRLLKPCQLKGPMLKTLLLLKQASGKTRLLKYIYSSHVTEVCTVQKVVQYPILYVK